MTVSAPVAADIPGIYDLIIGQAGGTMRGYMLARQIDPNIPFRTQRARYSISQTFIERTNVSGDFGDNQQDFWLTATQRDWSLGEDQRHFEPSDATRSKQFYKGRCVNISVPGEITNSRAMTPYDIGTAVGVAHSIEATNRVYAGSATNLFRLFSPATFLDIGAHGAGARPDCYADDASFLYISGSSCTTVRKMDLGTEAFSAFSAQPADSLLYLNNTLYGTKNNVLYTYDSTGVASASFTFKTATGAALSGTMKLLGLGGKPILLRTTKRAELWEYDGTGVALLAEFPEGFVASNFCESMGIIFVIGDEGGDGGSRRQAIYYYANGNVGRAWAALTAASQPSDITAFGNGLVFPDLAASALRFYDLSNGAVSTLDNLTSNVGNGYSLAATKDYVWVIDIGSSVVTQVDAVTYPILAEVYSSLFDFGSSLTKIFRGVTIDFELGGSSTGTLDIAYQVDSLTGAYTTLATGVTSSTEVTFPSTVTGRAISIKVTMNCNSGTTGPKLKRMSLRAAPKLKTFRLDEFIIDLTGVKGRTPVQLRNEMSHPKDGKTQATNLRTDLLSGNPLTIIDRFGSYTGIIESGTFDLVEVAPDEFYCRFQTREI